MSFRSSRTKLVAISVTGVVVLLQLPGQGVGKVYVVSGQHTQASDDNPGTAAEPFKTINYAAQIAQPGDTVLVHAGVYRERVTPAQGGRAGQPIVYQAAPGEDVILKGSELWCRTGSTSTTHGRSIVPDSTRNGRQPAASIHLTRRSKARPTTNG